MVPADGARSRNFVRRLGRAIWPAVAPAPSTENARLTQAKLFAEIARRVDEPIEALPSGDATLVSLLLWQRAAAWAIAATRASPDGGTEARALLEHVAGGSESLTRIETMIGDEIALPGAEPSELGVRVATLARFSRGVIEELERPGRAARRLRRVRAIRLVSGLAAVIALTWLIVGWTRPPDLIPNARRVLSSESLPCVASECGDAVFHTGFEANPWVRYDLGSSKELHSIEIRNRTDCCSERALPLVIETSNDANAWTEQARVVEPFVSWSSKLRARARYVRLRVANTTYFHLSSVRVR